MMHTRRWLTTSLVLALILLCVVPASKGQATDWKKIIKPPLHAFHPQQPVRVALPNGMVVFLQEDHELPLINGTARIRGGSREEPAEKASLVNIFGQAWRTGGTKTRTGDQLDDYLEARAARVETSGGVDSTTVAWSCLKEDFDEVFKIFVELLREPEFRGDKIELAKRQISSQIARRNDNPLEIAQREAMKLAHGASSPYARVPEYATVAAITREDLLNWHRTYVWPNNIVLGVVGDFDARSLEAKLREAFTSWPAGPAAKKVEVAFNEPKPGIYFAPKDDVNQSSIRMVHLGTTRDNPDYYALEVLNEAFGSGISSRLFSNIRSKKGLAYYVFGRVGTEYDHPGVFILGMGTKSSTTATSVDALREELDGLEKNPISAEELKKAKDSILNSFVFRFDSKQKVLGERMAYEFYDYPADFLERYRTGIEKVTQADVARVAQKYIHKDRLAILVVGKAADFDRQLSSFGPVTTLDITIPAPGGAPAKPAAGSKAAGKALLARVIEGLGGAGKVASVHAVRAKSTIDAKTPQGEFNIGMEMLSVFPDQFWMRLATPMGEVTMVATAQAAFVNSPQGTQDMPPSQKEEMMKQLRRDAILVAQHADDPKFTFTAAGTAKIGDVEAQILDVNADGAEARWFVDPQTGKIVRTSAHIVDMGGPAEQVLDLGEWKEFGGIPFATKAKITRDGQDAGSVQVEAVEINPVVDPKLFEKP